MTELPTGPSTTASLRSQMTEYRMRTEYRRVLRGVWLRADVEPTFDVMGRAAAVAFPDGTLCGWSAAHLWGNTALPRDRRPEIAVPVDGRRHAGVHVRRMQLDDDHITVVDDVRCTTLARTAIDLARFSARDDAVAALDVMTRRRPDLPAQMRAELRDWENHWGVDKAHRASRLIDPAAESPWETRLRLAVVDEGLDGWVCQWEVFGGRYRLDMAWPQWKVACEYDGAHHRDGSQHADDIERWNALRADHWIVFPATARILNRGRAVYLERVRHALMSRGWTPELAA